MWASTRIPPPTPATRPATLPSTRSLLLHSALPLFPPACLPLQAALQDNLRTARELNRRAEEIVAAHVEALLEVDMDEAAALTYLREATPGILR